MRSKRWLGVALLCGGAICLGATSGLAQVKKDQKTEQKQVQKKDEKAPVKAPETAKIEELVVIPEAVAEIITVEPSTEHVWVPGYWDRDGESWTWIKGRWEKPPHKQAYFDKGHWALEEGTWKWHKGHWAVGDRGKGLIVDEVIEVPSALKDEANKGAAPSEKHTWIGPRWEWEGHWVHCPGFWTVKPSPEAEWAPGRWVDGPKGHRWLYGHWDVKK